MLYPTPLRDILLEVGSKGLYRPKWTAQIHEEWMGRLLSGRPDLTREKLERTRTLMDRSVPDCLVEGYEHVFVVYPPCTEHRSRTVRGGLAGWMGGK